MSTVSRRQIRILHVDDDPDFTDLTATFLEREDDRFIVDTATSADEGLQILADQPLDCIVSDYDMPGMNGIEFLKAVRDQHPELPFILYTGKGSEAVAGEAISAGVTDYIQKESGTEQYALLANRCRNAVKRHRAEQARQRHLEAIESAQEGISILNEDGEFIYVNERYAAIYGYDPDEMLGEHWELIYPDDEASFARDEILPTVAEEGAWHGETTGLRADGTTFPEDHVVSQTRQGDLVCTVRDLSEQRNRETELWLKTRAMDEAPVGITLSDPSQEDNPLIYVNERFEELTGYDEQEAVGRNCRFLQGEGTDPEPVATMREAIDAQEPVTVELRNYRKDGTGFWNRVRVAPITSDDGTVTNYVGFQEDITERKERERDLHEKSNFLDQLFEQVPIHLYVKDTDGRYLYVSEFYVREEHNWIADDTDEILGKTDLEFNEGVGKETYADDMRVIETGEPVIDKEEYDPRFDNWFLTSKVPWYGPDGEISGLIGVTRRITERKRAEQELERKNERLEEFASFVSHDLRNPLNVAQSRLELARQECDSTHLDFVADAHDRMDALITDLLALAREGSRGDETEAVDLGETVEKCVRNVETGGATVRIETDRTVGCDRAGLEQLLENLVQNAVEHGGADVTITIGDRDGGFFVADDGPGIPETERDRVFERGYSTGKGGTGLGLSIVQEIAEAHGWEVSVTESEQGGARFEITDVDLVER